MEGWGRLSRKYLLKFFSKEKSPENRPQDIAQQVSSLELKVKLSQIQWFKLTWLIIHMIITKFLTQLSRALTQDLPGRIQSTARPCLPAEACRRENVIRSLHSIGPVHHFESTWWRSSLTLESTCSLHSIHRPAPCLRCLMQEVAGSFSLNSNLSLLRCCLVLLCDEPGRQQSNEGKFQGNQFSPILQQQSYQSVN